MNHKLVGCCTICEREVFEILERYPNDHPLSREPRRVGKPLDNAVRVTFLLTNGSRMDLTFCEDCSNAFDLPAIWKKVMTSWEREMDNEHRIKIGTKPIEKEKRKYYKNWFKQMTETIPLGLLYKEKWQNIND